MHDADTVNSPAHPKAEMSVDTNAYHDPIDFAAQLSSKLATRSRHVCALLGAGVGRACRLPDVRGLQDLVLDDLDRDDRSALAAQFELRNLEETLSRLRRVSALLGPGETVDGLTAERSAGLDQRICRSIIGALNLSNADLEPVEDFCAWTARAGYRLPLELFTVNYDLLLESGLESRGVPYFDGFIGALEARFRADLVESSPGTEDQAVPAFFVRLWKLHGSVNWLRRDDGRVVRLGVPVPEDQAAAIYPSDAKYEESRRVPFVVLQDQLRRSTSMPETMMVVAGYSFADEHVNELIFDAASRCERSEYTAFCHGEIPEELARRARSCPNLQVVGPRDAVLGGLRGEWRAPQSAVPNVWDGERLLLTDFRHLAAYLARSPAGGHSVSTGQDQEPLATREGAPGMPEHG